MGLCLVLQVTSCAHVKRMQISNPFVIQPPILFPPRRHPPVDEMVSTFVLYPLHPIRQLHQLNNVKTKTEVNLPFLRF